jgi:cytochrome c5
MVDGSTRVAMTCATCHASVQDGVYVRGLPNANLDVGQLLVDAGGLLPDVARATAAWGPGRLDVSSTDGKEAARIPDLRPVRELGFLQQDATVLQRNIASLALRTETLVITSQGEDVRPPREVALGLAIYVWSLAAALPAPPATSSPGGALLRASCAPCHASPGFTGAPVSIAEAGTDPTLGLSPQRGTGAYRVPSLRGVGSRGPLFHDASAPSLAAFFDPARASASFTGGRGGGPIPGHAWSLGLGAADRALLLTTLGAM